MKKIISFFTNRPVWKTLVNRIEGIKKTFFGNFVINQAVKLKKIPLALAIIFFSVLISILIVKTRPETQAQPKIEKIWPVAVISAESIDMQPKITIYGEVRASRMALIRSKLRGKIVSLNPSFKDGNFVESGVELLTIERARYEHQTAEKRADLFHSEAVLEELKKELIFEENSRSLRKSS